MIDRLDNNPPFEPRELCESLYTCDFNRLEDWLQQNRLSIDHLFELRFEHMTLHWTILHFASFAGRLEIARWAIARGANLEKKTKQGETAIILAAYDCEGDVFPYLIQKGVNINAQTKDGKCLLSILLSSTSPRHRDNIHLLLRQPGINLQAKDKKGRIPLISYLESVAKIEEHEEPEFLEALLPTNQPANTWQPTGQSTYDGRFLRALYEYTKKGLFEHGLTRHIIIEQLVNLRAEDGATALMNAIKYVMTNLEVEIELLIDRGAKLNLQDRHGKTALMIAVERLEGQQQNTIVGILLDQGADINLQDFRGNTALHYPGVYNPQENGTANNFHSRAFRNRNYRRKPYEVEADLTIRNFKGETCFDVLIKTHGMEAFWTLDYMGK